MSSSQTKPLIGAASETSVDVGAPRLVGSAPSSSSAYWVAGFTVLACLLIAGQGLVAYFMLRQGSDITSLEKQSNELHEKLIRSQPASVPMRMSVPMNMMPLMVDEEGSSTQAVSAGQDRLSECQTEAAGMKPAKQRLPWFQPQCDALGNYNSQQCWQGGRVCWCVDAHGRQVGGTVARGRGRLCTAAVE